MYQCTWISRNFSASVSRSSVGGVHSDGGGVYATEAVLDATDVSHDVTFGV